MKRRLKYRLALDLGSTSLGWAVLRLDNVDSKLAPTAIVKAGVRIFNDGREPKTETSLAVRRRQARALRRRRDRLLRRKARMMKKLIEYGFFPQDEARRKALERLDPYELRARGLNEALKPEEFARALFHINQRRGFKSNRKTDKDEKDAGALKMAIKRVRDGLAAWPLDRDGQPALPNVADREGKMPEGETFDLLAWLDSARAASDKAPRTIGELLYLRKKNQETVRARKIGQNYNFYVDRAMIEQEFDALWAKQASFDPVLFHEKARRDLKDTLLFQRKLHPVTLGRCTLLPEEARAPLALPSQQRFRIYQEVNNLRWLDDDLCEEPLTLAQRDQVVAMLERQKTADFAEIKEMLGFQGDVIFNLEDASRKALDGNATSVTLSKQEYFGEGWFEMSLEKQDEVVEKLLTEQGEGALIAWLQKECGLDEAVAERLGAVSLKPGYGRLSHAALERIVPVLAARVVTYDRAVQDAGFAHHSDLGFDFKHDAAEVERVIAPTGEPVPVFRRLPYYGRALRRHVAFARDKPRNEEERYGKIANPTVHIGLNQIRIVVNALIERYGHPTEVVIELARELKQSHKQKKEMHDRQTDNQKRNERIRQEIASILNIDENAVSRIDMQKWILWEELPPHNSAERRCPYSGRQISAEMLFNGEVEIEHILPFSQTLDDSLNNKTVALQMANRIKGNRTPWEARADFELQGWRYDDIIQRASTMPRGKRFRFAADGLQQWLREDSDFSARALNDTRYLSRVAKAYLGLICPAEQVRAIPGKMTAMLRAKLGLNNILGLQGEKNRNDHRHHAVDACVIGITDQGMLQRFARASAQAYGNGLDRLVEKMPVPWSTYRNHVKRAIDAIWVSHKPEHGYEGAIFDETIYGLRGEGKVAYRKVVDGKRVRPVFNRKVIPFADAAPMHYGRQRHGTLESGQPKPYMGLWSRSNYCLEIEQEENKEWSGHIIERYQAYRIVSRHGVQGLRNFKLGAQGKPLVMRLCIGDTVLVEIDGEKKLLQVLKTSGEGGATFILHNETNIPARYTARLAARKAQAENDQLEVKKGSATDKKPVSEDDLNDDFFQKSISPSSLRAMRARQVFISPIGELRDPGFKY